jgi:hypothetical protein
MASSFSDADLANATALFAALVFAVPRDGTEGRADVVATHPVLDRLGIAAGEHPLQSRWLRRSAIMKSAFMVAVVGLMLTAIVAAVFAPNAGRAIHRWMTDRGWW